MRDRPNAAPLPEKPAGEGLEVVAHCNKHDSGLRKHWSIWADVPLVRLSDAQARIDALTRELADSQAREAAALAERDAIRANFDQVGNQAAKLLNSELAAIARANRLADELDALKAASIPAQDAGEAKREREAEADTLIRWRRMLLGYDWLPRWTSAAACLAVADDIAVRLSAHGIGTSVSPGEAK